MASIKTVDAHSALRTVLRERTQAAAGNNTVLSKEESARLDPFLRKAEQELRAEAGKGARVSVDKLVDRAMLNADKVWNQFNPPGKGADSTFLSQDELKQVERADPSLGELSRLAYLRAGKSGQDAATVVRGFFDRFDFTDRALRTNLPGSVRLDARPGMAGRQGVPTEVLKGFDAFYRAEEQDWATVSLNKAKLGGQDIYAVYVTTDGDDSALEVYTTAGKPLASARLNADKILEWDSFFGRGRLDASFLQIDNPQITEGYSEPAERAAAGQIPAEWRGDVKVDSGRIHHAMGMFVNADLPAAFTLEQRQVATAAFELIWDHVLTHRREGDAPLDMARQGSLQVGTFTRPTDGKSFLVANWNDIDDASHTFYFDRHPDGLLRLAVNQSNG